MREDNDDILKEISSSLLKWAGIIICVLCASSFFISSEWLLEETLKSHYNHMNNDSDANMLNFKVEQYFLELALWLKGLSIKVKIGGLIGGGLLWFVNSDSE